MARKDISDELVCRAYYTCRKAGVPQWPYDLLAEWTGEPLKVCYRAMKRAFDRGYIDYGVSLRGGFLTEKGKDFLVLAELHRLKALWLEYVRNQPLDDRRKKCCWGRIFDVSVCATIEDDRFVRLEQISEGRRRVLYEEERK